MKFKIITLLLSLTFFLFVDDRFRAWDDTNQFQIETKAWVRGSRPPVKEILADQYNLGAFGPTHTNALVPFVWSWFANGSDSWREALFRIRVFQASMIIISFIGVMVFWGGDLSALIFSIVVFFNFFNRGLIEAPLAEPLSFVLFITSYFVPVLSGASAVLQVVVRPAAVFLYLPILWRRKSNWKTILLGAAMLVVLLLFFKELFIPGAIKGSSFSIQKFLSAGYDFFQDASHQLFDHLFYFHGSSWFLSVFGGLLLAIWGRAAWTHKKRWDVWLATVLYLPVVVFLPMGSQGVRYIFPLILLWLFEFKPVLPRRRAAYLLCGLLALHLIVRQIDDGLEIRRDRFPETDSVGLNEARQWMKEHGGGVILMNKYRFCINYFETSCFGYIDYHAPQLIQYIREKQIKFFLISGREWQHEEGFVNTIQDTFRVAHIDYSENLIKFHDNVQLVDLRETFR